MKDAQRQPNGQLDSGRHRRNLPKWGIVLVVVIALGVGAAMLSRRSPVDASYGWYDEQGIVHVMAPDRMENRYQG